jgi:hypothetical protein
MRFFTGALSLAVICAIFGTPVAVLFGFAPLSAGNYKLGAGKKPAVTAASQQESKPATAAGSQPPQKQKLADSQEQSREKL